MNAKELKEIRKNLKLSQTKFGELVGSKLRTVQNWESGVNKIPDSVSKLLNKYTDNAYVNTLNDTPAEYKSKNEIGVPYYDVDFTASFLEVENSQVSKPNSYITHPFFIGCDFVVRASGQSMAKIIKHGDAVGLVKLDNWREFFPFGEVYGIVTTDGYRMFKVISQGQENDTYTLISKPTDNKKEDFPNQQIKKSLISHIYKVQASSHLF